MDLHSSDLRLLPALAASLLLHGALIGLPAPAGQARRTAAPFTPALNALLLPAPEIEAPSPALLHDTLAEEAPPPAASIEPAPVQAALEPATPQPAAAPAAEPVAARRHLAEHLFYPPEAVAAGIQGEVRVRLTLDPEGAVVDARLARGSGHASLDAAALRAAHALGRLPGAPAGELVLPVVFRLR